MQKCVSDPTLMNSTVCICSGSWRTSGCDQHASTSTSISLNFPHRHLLHVGSFYQTNFSELRKYSASIEGRDQKRCAAATRPKQAAPSLVGHVEAPPSLFWHPVREDIVAAQRVCLFIVMREPVTASSRRHGCDAARAFPSRPFQHRVRRRKKDFVSTFQKNLIKKLGQGQTLKLLNFQCCTCRWEVKIFTNSMSLD